MFEDSTVMAVVAVKDIERAKEFYGKTLGLEMKDENPGGVLYESGDGKLFVYESTYAGTNQATAANWEVHDIVDAVEELTEKGIKFELYDMPGVKFEGPIATMDDMKSAWFKDPDGNILAISES